METFKESDRMRQSGSEIVRGLGKENSELHDSAKVGASGKIIRLKALALMSGQMADAMKTTGSKT